jgi:hypothetical protein
MGVSTDGILVFGFPVGNEGEHPEFLGEHEDIDDFIAGEWKTGETDYAVRKAVIDACPADLTLHCSYDYSMYIIAVRGTELKCSRGDAVEVSAEHLAVSPERIAAFKAWCETAGIDYQEPRWLLTSLWG